MLLDIVLISVIIGFIRKGNLKGDLNFKHSWIVVVAFASQILGTWLLPQSMKSLAVIGSYLGLLLFAICNFNRQCIQIITLGIVLNLIPIIANGGMMPVSLDAATKVGYDVTPLVEGTVFKQQALTDQTILGFLGDVIPLQYPIPRVISLGDVAIFLGIFLLLQEFMGKPLQIFRIKKSKTC